MKRVMFASLLALGSAASAQFQNAWITPAFWPDNAGNLVIDKVYDVKTDRHGNTYVTGESDQASGGVNIVTIKYDRAGTRIWDRTYNNPAANGIDVPSAMVVDSEGTVWVTGKSQGADLRYDMVTLRYTTDGTPIPAIRLDAPGENYHYEGVDIALGSDGHVFVAGNRYFQSGMGAPNGTQYVTVRYDENGNIPNNMNWPAYFDRLPIGNDTAVAIAVGLPGNDVFVTGESRSENTTPFWATIKYPGAGPDESGNPIG